RCRDHRTNAWRLPRRTVPVSLRRIRLPFGTELPEIPAGDLLRDYAQPRVPAVVPYLATAVLAGEQALWLVQSGVGSSGSRYFADDLGGAPQLGAAQLRVVLPGVDQDGDPRIAQQVGPALAAHERGQPYGRSVPHVPLRGQVRALRARRGDPAGP